MRRRELCWVECTVCGVESFGGTVRYFAGEAELWAVMLDVGEYGWTRRDDGRVLCRGHSEVAECEAWGHELARWRPHPLDDDLDWRSCTRCGGAFTQRIATSHHPAGE